MALSTEIKLWLKGLLGVHDDSDSDVSSHVDRMFRHTATYPIPNTDGSNAAAAVTDAYFWRANTACKLIAAHVFADSAVTANDTNYATFQLKAGDGAGGNLAVLANAATTVAGTGNIVANIPEALSIQTAAITAGQVLTFGATKTGTGVDLPAGKLVVVVEED